MDLFAETKPFRFGFVSDGDSKPDTKTEEDISATLRKAEEIPCYDVRSKCTLLPSNF